VNGKQKISQGRDLLFPIQTLSETTLSAASARSWCMTVTAAPRRSAAARIPGWLTGPKLRGAGALFDFGCYGADLATWLMEVKRPNTVTEILDAASRSATTGKTVPLADAPALRK